MLECKNFSGGKIMTEILSAGENVRHNKKADWGIGKIVKVEKGGTIRVVFEGNRKVSIAKGSKYLSKIS
jgi:hypothetical protein